MSETPSLPRLDNFGEPKLLFGFDQTLADPKDGLFMFGPLVDRTKPAEMRIGVIGTPNGIARYNSWVDRAAQYIPAKKAEQHHLAFPGFEAAFKTAWRSEAIVELQVSAEAIASTVRISNAHERVFKTVELFEKPIKDYLRQEEATPAMWFVVIPDEIHQFCRPKSIVPMAERTNSGPAWITKRLARSLISEPSMFGEENEAAEPYRYEVDFHNQLKAKLLDKQAVLQIVRESTIAPDDIERETGKKRRLQDPASVAWNLCTTAYFKAGGKPWSLDHVREGVCYIGLVFKKTEIDPDSGNACCGAQMFLGSGDGIVFKGAVGPWYSATTKECHLPGDKAEQITKLVVDEYRKKHGKPPSELFIHAKQHFSDLEWAGFLKGVPAETRLVGVRIRQCNDIKLFRGARSPVMRGTAYRLTQRMGYLWTLGFIPELQTYPGRDVPNPLLVEITRGETDLAEVMKDVLGLTKLNFNACIFGDGLPVTLRFADDVGEILTAAPIADLPPLPFKHYI